MLYQNKYIIILLLFTLASIPSLKSQPEKPILPFVYNTITVAKDLQLQQNLSKYRLIMIPAILGIGFYFNQSTLNENITKHPLTFLALTYLLGNYIIDSVSKYHQLNHTLQFFMFSQTMNRYILAILAIKNTMKNTQIKQNQPFNEQEFLNIIIQNTGHTLEELELFTFELLNSSIHAIRNLCIDINTTDMEEKIYYLFKEQITLEQVLLICQEHHAMHQQLSEFYQNPELTYQSTLQTLCKKIQAHFNTFIKKKLHFI